MCEKLIKLIKMSWWNEYLILMKVAAFVSSTTIKWIEIEWKTEKKTQFLKDKNTKYTDGVSVCGGVRVCLCVI